MYKQKNNPKCPYCGARNKNVAVVYSGYTGSMVNTFLDCHCHNIQCQQRYLVYIDAGKMFTHKYTNAQ